MMSVFDAIMNDYFDVPTKVGPYGPKLDRAHIVRHRKLLNKLREVHPNLSFVKSALKSSFKDMAASKDWKMSAVDLQDFSEKMACRVGLMCRHLSQALCKTPPPKWAEDVLDKKQALLEDT